MERKISFQSILFQQSTGSCHCRILACSRGYWYIKLSIWNRRILRNRGIQNSRQISANQTFLSQESGLPDQGEVVSPIPNSLTRLSENSLSALIAATEAGYKRLLIDIDFEQGDSTYTTFKNAVPFLRELLRVIESRNWQTTTTLLFPDEGSAAFARKDWNISKCSFLSFGSYSGKDSSQDWLIMICPSAVDVEAMEQIVNRESPFLSKDARPIILINPKLVDMGATGLGFNARQLRQQFLSTFESIYFLRVYTWGVVVRQYPFRWSVWLDTANSDENSSSEEAPYRLLRTFENKPNDDTIQEIFLKSVQKKTFGTQRKNWFQSFVDFLKWYSKG
ncbi:Deubiquitination-protection protein dph1 [Galdieria sulphuraria]|nr:Deubiquitination-protection protein dph1 [Galdieria sulphuraria]